MVTLGSNRNFLRFESLFIATSLLQPQICGHSSVPGPSSVIPPKRLGTSVGPYMRRLGWEGPGYEARPMGNHYREGPLQSCWEGGESHRHSEKCVWEY